MKKLVSILLCVSLLLSFQVTAFSEENPDIKSESQDTAVIDEESYIYEPDAKSISTLDDGSAYVNDCVTVFFKANAVQKQIADILKLFNNNTVGFVKPLNQYQIKIKPTSYNKIKKLCDFLMGFDAIEFACPSFINRYSPDYIPDDPWDKFPEWHSSYIRSVDCNWWIRAVEADEAWEYSSYFNHIKVGIVDSGFDTEHEDLQGKFVFPTKYFEKSNRPACHGTHVAGIIGASQNNGVGITGLVPDCELVCVDWNPDKAAKQFWVTEERILTGFVYTILNGAKVVNLSLGSSGDILNGTTQRYKIAIDAEAVITSYIIAKLVSLGYDFLAVQAAGNGTTLKNGEFYAVDSTNNGKFSCITPENVVTLVDGVTKEDILDRVVIVGASNCMLNQYTMSYFSNGGKNVSIYAPGTAIYSTSYDAESTNPTHNMYESLSGTSMAAPIVTGVASLVWSVNPDFTGPQVKKIICSEENTPIIVKDSQDPCHLPTGDGRLVNAKLSVEEAISRLDELGTVQGKLNWNKLGKDEIPYVITNKITGETYWDRTLADGTYQKKLPEGSYTIRFEANGEETLETEFTVVAGETTEAQELFAQNQSAFLAEKAKVAFKDFVSFYFKLFKLIFKIWLITAK